MKRIAIALLASVAALAASSARADTRVHVGVSVGAPVYTRPPVVAYTPPVPCPPPAVVHYLPARGYWKDVVVKTWVPERWIVRRDHWGRPIRVCEPGYYTYRTERVWVDGHRGHGHAHGYRR